MLAGLWRGAGANEASAARGALAPWSVCALKTTLPSYAWDDIEVDASLLAK